MDETKCQAVAVRVDARARDLIQFAVGGDGGRRRLAAGAAAEALHSVALAPREGCAHRSRPRPIATKIKCRSAPFASLELSSGRIVVSPRPIKKRAKQSGACSINIQAASLDLFSEVHCVFS